MAVDKKKSAGIFGGTFDPIHMGHIKAAREIREKLELDAVYFIPAGRPPHKQSENVSSARDRLRMVELALADIPYLIVLDYEVGQEGVSYTVDTLRHLKSTEPDTEFYFIVGNELFKYIESWKDYKTLFELSNFAVLRRPGFEDRQPEQIPLALRDEFRYHKSVGGMTFYKGKSGKLVFINISGMEVSSTRIRETVRAGGRINGLVPESVREYISSNHLYSGRTNP